MILSIALATVTGGLVHGMESNSTSTPSTWDIGPFFGSTCSFDIIPIL